MGDFFEVTEVLDHITRIRGLAGECMYLVEGADKAALIDTGIGIGNLRELVDSITEKPVAVILTHGHVDHALAAGLFDEVYMSGKDASVYEENSKIPHRNRFFETVIDNWEQYFETEVYITTVKPVENLLPLEDGQSFDLGGLTVTAYALPGHTPGSMAILFEEDRILLLGDSCNPNTFLYDHNSCTVEEYRENLIRFKEKVDGRFDRVLLSHESGETDTGVVDSAIELTGDIMEGRSNRVPFEYLGVKALFARAIDENGKRLDGGLANIVYSPDKIFKQQ